MSDSHAEHDDEETLGQENGSDTETDDRGDEENKNVDKEDDGEVTTTPSGPVYLAHGSPVEMEEDGKEEEVIIFLCISWGGEEEEMVILALILS